MKGQYSDTEFKEMLQKATLKVVLYQEINKAWIKIGTTSNYYY